MKIFKRLKPENSGFTLMEIIVATSIFAVFIVVIVNIFQAVVEDQRRTIAMQNIQENLRYVLEVMSKDIRQAKRSDDNCETPLAVTYGTDYRVFNTNDAAAAENELYFRNKKGECVRYYLSGGRLWQAKDTGANLPATPDELTITGLKFIIRDNDVDTWPIGRIQPLVTLKFTAGFSKLGSRYQQPITIQTSVSSRFYE